MQRSPPPVRSSNKAQVGKDKGSGDKTVIATVDRPPSSSSTSSSSSKSEREPFNQNKAAIKELVTELLTDSDFLNNLAERVAQKLSDRLEENIYARVMSVCEPRMKEMEHRIDSL
ncbi:hypothetical protein LSTR_LSTR016668, partial [Laodelphax striatellus]